MTEKTDKLIFVIGGASSGKSAFALDCANECSGRKVYIATAQAFDDEMRKRIEKHKDERGGDWETIEEPVRLSDVIKTASVEYDVVLVDCLTLWLSNLMHADMDVEKETASIVPSLLARGNARIFIVSNEVGMGIVPDNELARRFRDFAGKLNQKVAAAADEIYLVATGIPLKIK